MVRAIDEALVPDRLLVVLHHAETHAPFVAHSAGPSNPGPSDAPVKFVIRDGPRVLSTVTSEDREDVGERDERVRSWMGAPVLAAGRPIGAVLIASETAGRYGPDDLDLLQAVTAQLGMAVENARLLRLLSLGKLEWEQTVDAIGQAFCLVDARGRIRRANKAFARVVELPVTGLAGQAWREILPRAWIKTIEQAVADRDVRHPRTLERGHRRYTVAGLELVQPPGTSLLIFEDETEKHQLQQQLIQSEKLSAIGELIAGVVHDLRNPLATVIALADFLSEEPLTPEEHQEPLGTIRVEAERASTLVQNLLNFGRKTSGPRRRQSVAPILHATLQLMQHEFTSSGVHARVELPDEPLEIDVHPDRLQQVLINLLQNAAQAIKSSRIGGEVRLAAARDGADVVIVIEDDGPGIPASIASQIFDPFFTTKTEGQGTGLGLSISQGILRDYEGGITLESPRTGGAIFRIRLPRVEPGTPATPPD